MKIYFPNEVIAKNKILLACSGGIDSVVLLYLLKEQWPGMLEVYHCNYQLRANESDLDQIFVEQLCKQLGIKVHIHKACKSAKPSRMGIQEWARTVRFNHFREYINKGYVVALAHHQDDLAENVLLRLLRGVSARNLMGMSVYREGLFRPLLEVPRSLISLYAKKNKIKFRFDSSNARTDYRRNYLRLKIFPILEELQPGFAKRMVDTAFDANQSLEYLRALDAIKGLVQSENHLNILGLETLPRSVALEALTTFLNPYEDIQLCRENLINLYEDIMSRKERKFLDRQLNQQVLLRIENHFLVKTSALVSVKKIRCIQHDKNFSQRKIFFVLNKESILNVSWQRDDQSSVAFSVAEISNDHPQILSLGERIDKERMSASLRKKWSAYLRSSTSKDRARLLLFKANQQEFQFYSINSGASHMLGLGETPGFLRIGRTNNAYISAQI